MRSIYSARHLSQDTPPAGDPTPVVEDANSPAGTPALLFLGLIAMGVLLLAFVLAPRVDRRTPVGEFEPSADPSVDAYAVVDAEAGTYRVPVDTIIAKVAKDHAMLAPIAPAGGFVEVDTSTPEGLGQALFSELTCNACHSINGPRMVGPTMQGIFGRAGKFADGSAYTADEAYLTESILAPMAKVVEGYPPAMVLPRQPSDEETANLVAYLKTL